MLIMWHVSTRRVGYCTASALEQFCHKVRELLKKPSSSKFLETFGASIIESRQFRNTAIRAAPAIFAKQSFIISRALKRLPQSRKQEDPVKADNKP
jgi:hypothetical protein